MFERDLGIKLKFVLWVAIVLVGVLFMLAALLIHNQSQTMKNQITEQGKILGQFISTSVESPLLYGDAVELERIVKEISQKHKNAIDYILILDDRDRPLTFTSKKPTKIDSSKTLVLSTPILDDLGRVEIGFSLTSVNRQIMTMIINVAAAIILAILFSGLGIILISRKLIIQPAFQVEQINKQLRELTQELDKKVQERTRELQVAKNLAEKEKDKTLTIIQSLADGLIVLDPYGTIAMVNPEAEKMIGLPKEKIERKKLNNLEENLFFQKLINLILKNGSIKQVFRENLNPKENTVIEVTTIPLIGEDSELGGYVIIFHDVSREKIVEKLKTEFVTLAAHQLRTPLSKTKWTLEMLLGGDMGKITKEQREFIKKTYGANERMINLINDLLDVSRIEEGKYLYESKPANIEDIIELIIESFQEEIKKKKLIFEFKKPKEKLAPIIIDAEKMQLAIQNILENAIRYNKTGGKVTVILESNGKEIKFSVQDTGMGIPKSQATRVFTKFFRAPNVIKMETEGTGLGLFIAKNIIEVHKGRIWFESEEGKGSTFYFTLPITPLKPG